jgi:hypothetical protein
MSGTEELNSNYIPFHRQSAAGLKVVVVTPLDEGGRGGIDRMMDAIRCQFREHPRANVDLQFVISRGANIFLSPIVLVWALLRIIFMRARQGIDLPFPSKIGALTMMNESTVDFRHFSLDQLVCAEMAHGLVSARWQRTSYCDFCR